MAKGSKTKKVGGTDLAAHHFLWVHDVKNTDTWLLPIFDPTSAKKTVNLIKTSIYRFDDVARKIPDEEHFALRAQLTGAAQSYGLTEAALIELTDEEMALMLAERAATKALADIMDEYECE